MDLHVAYGAYFATGEGVTHWIAISNTEAGAIAVWDKHVDPYYRRDVASWDDFMADAGYRELLPPEVIRRANGAPCNFEFFTKLHLNYS